MDEKTQRFEMRVSKLFLEAIDEWRRCHPDLPSRASAVRLLVEKAIGADENSK
jgi:hypothetical protein